MSRGIHCKSGTSVMGLTVKAGISIWNEKFFAGGGGQDPLLHHKLSSLNKLSSATICAKCCKTSHHKLSSPAQIVVDDIAHPPPPHSDYASGDEISTHHIAWAEYYFLYVLIANKFKNVVMFNWKYCQRLLENISDMKTSLEVVFK